MTRLLLIVALLLAVAFAPTPPAAKGLRVGSKKFTESVILGEIAVQLIQTGGDDATHLAELGGTQLVFDALRQGEIDVYPEYTGTLRQEIFAGRDAATDDDLRILLKAEGLVMSNSLGFSNNYALAVTRETASRLGLTAIDDLRRYPDLRMGLSNEFIDRHDGWTNLRRHYGLPQRDVNGMDHDLAYRHLQAGLVDVMEVYTTDAKIVELDLVLLEDNRRYFSTYDAVLVWRADLAERFPIAVEQLRKLESQISQRDITELNALVESGRANESLAGAGFLRDKFSLTVSGDEESVTKRLWRRTLEHCDLVRRSLIPAVLVAIPLGVLAAKRPRLGRLILNAVGIVQTIPALALLVLLIAPVAYLGFTSVGAGSATAVAALFLYSLLPVVQNTATGLTSIPSEYWESAEALGLSRRFRLFHIELPLAAPAILAGVKTAAVMNVGFATLGALVGARGYGQPILTGIRLNDTGLILQGAIPAACLAILFQLAFELIERRVLPLGLRSPSSPKSA
jgi:osmoprotectant transport system permease protein